ncbi:proteasome assembly chaperone family protein [Halobacteriaceae archaeon GCM10025711]
MSDADSPVRFETLTDLGDTSPTLVEGLPGHGLVASITVDQLNDQLGLEHHGNIISEEFPPVASFKDGRVRDMVRVYAGQNPDILTLQSDLALPPEAFRPLSETILHDLASEFDRAIFLAGAPAANEEQIGEVTGVATTADLETELTEAGVELAEGNGLVGGITGSLVNSCYHNDVPAVVLVVRSHPYLPDPAAARSVIENALEPLVGFDIDTTELEEQSDRIRRRMQQIAEQFQALQEQQGGQQPKQSPTPSMYQ